MATTDVLNWMLGRRGKPTPVGDGVSTQARASRYGEPYVLPLFTTKHALADEGSYFTAMNATPGTGIAQTAAVTSFTDTIAFMVIKNNAAVGSNVRLYLDRLKLILTASATAIASVDFLVKLDTIDRSPTTASTGTTLTPVNVNMDDSSASNAVIIAYNATASMTVAASSASARKVTRAHAATGLGFAGDSLIVQFGATEASSTMGLTAVRAVGASQTVCEAAPVIIGPQQTAVLYRWSLTEAAAVSYEYELSWFERAA